MKKLALFFLIFALPWFVFAQADPTAADLAEEPCPNPKKLRGLCGYVGNFTKDDLPQGRYEYTYQRRILEAACVDINKDSDEEISRKIALVWKENEDALICNNTQFDVGNGSVIKYAVISGFDHFVFDIATWKINLNKIDETDGRTVLDYVKYHLDRAKGTASERRLKLYYAVLKDAGAKHKSEL
jgi:hypothetical protein